MPTRSIVPLSSTAAMGTGLCQAAADDHLVELWLHGRPRHTQRAYRADVDRFLAFVATPLATVALGDVQAFSNTLAGLGAQLEDAHRWPR